MSAKFTYLSWDLKIKNMALKLALIQIANNSNDDGESYYSIDKMADACGMSRRTFQTKISELETMGIMFVKRRSNRTSLYTLLEDEMMLLKLAQKGVQELHPSKNTIKSLPLGVQELHVGVQELPVGVQELHVGGATVAHDLKKDLNTSLNTPLNKSKAKASNRKDFSNILYFIPIKGNKDYKLRQNHIDKLKTAYPSVDLTSEILKMISWLDSNPTRKKANNGMPRFINGWLLRQTEENKINEPKTSNVKLFTAASKPTFTPSEESKNAQADFMAKFTNKTRVK